jgi:NADH dehydrogenase
MGDCCSCILPGSERPVPAHRQPQMADTVAENLTRMMKGQPLKDFVYRPRLFGLAQPVSTVGGLMGNLVGGRMAVEGRIARFVYTSLYRIAHHRHPRLGKGACHDRHWPRQRDHRPRLKLH